MGIRQMVVEIKVWKQGLQDMHQDLLINLEMKYIRKIIEVINTITKNQ